MARTTGDSSDPYDRDPYEGIDPTERMDAAERIDQTERLDPVPARAAEAGAADDLFDEAPIDGRPDELEERAERRGLGRGLLVGAIAAALLAGLVIWLLNGPLAARPAPDNTVPVTSLPNDGSLQPEPSPTGPADGGPLTAPPSATAAPSASTAPATASPDATEAAPATPAEQGGEVPFSISRANWIPQQQMISVAGLVPGVVASDGTCTLTATKDGQTYTATGPAQADAQSTVCAVNFSDPGLTPGQWTVELRYDGAAGTGAAQQQVTVG